MRTHLDLNRSLLFLRISLLFLVLSIPTLGWGQGEYPIGSWECWRYPGEVRQIEVGADEVFFAAQNGIWHWNRNDNRWLPPYTIVPKFAGTFDLNRILGVSVDFSSILALSEHGTYERDPSWGYWRESNTTLPKPDPKIKNPYVMPSPESIVGWRLPNGWSTMSPTQVVGPNQESFSVASGVTDTRGITWWKLSKIGVAHGSSSVLEVKIHRLGPSENRLLSLAQFKDGWLVGGSYRGLSSFVPKSGEWDWAEPGKSGFAFNKGDIHDIAVDRKKNVFWLATSQGLVTGTSFETGNWRRYGITEGLSDDFIQCVAVRPGGVLVGTNNGIDFFRSPKSVKRIRRDPKEPVSVRAIVTGDTFAFAASDRAILYVNFSDTTCSVLEGPPGFASDNWRCLSLTSNELWAGNSEGVVALDLSSGKWGSWRSSAYFGDGVIQAIAATDSVVWVGTNEGLFRIDRKAKGRLQHDPSELASPRVHQYTTRDGLADACIRRILISGKDLYMATDGGLSIFHYDQDGRILE